MADAAKPLAWREPGAGDVEADYTEALADGIGGIYAITRDQVAGFLLWFAHDAYVWEAFAEVEAAKTRAENDWQTRFAELLIAGTQP